MELGGVWMPTYRNCVVIFIAQRKVVRSYSPILGGVYMKINQFGGGLFEFHSDLGGSAVLRVE